MTTIALLGDSTYETPWLAPTTLAVALAAELTALGITAVVTSHKSAIGGTDTNEALAPICSWDEEDPETRSMLEMALAVDPDYVVIGFGLNDYNAGVSKAQYKSNVQAMITAIAAAGAVPVLCNNFYYDYPRSFTLYDLNAAVSPFCDAMSELAVSNACPLVDLRAAFEAQVDGGNYLLYDPQTNGWHQNASGRGLQSTTIAASMAVLLPTFDLAVSFLPASVPASGFAGVSASATGGASVRLPVAGNAQAEGGAAGAVHAVLTAGGTAGALAQATGYAAMGGVVVEFDLATRFYESTVSVSGTAGASAAAGGAVDTLLSVGGGAGATAIIAGAVGHAGGPVAGGAWAAAGAGDELVLVVDIITIMPRVSVDVLSVPPQQNVNPLTEVVTGAVDPIEWRRG